MGFSWEQARKVVARRAQRAVVLYISDRFGHHDGDLVG